MPIYLTIPNTAEIYSDKMPGDYVFCITVKDLTDCGISESTVQSGLNRHKKGLVYCWPHHKANRTVYLHYDGLKDEYKKLIRAFLMQNLEPGTWWNLTQKDALIKERLIKNLSTLSPDENEILNLKLPTGEEMPEAERVKLRTASIWADFILKHENKADLLTIGYDSAAEFYSDLIYYCKNEEIKLPYTYAKLKAKLRDYKKHGISALIDKRLCTNSNAAKIKTPEQHAVLMQIMSHHNGLDAAQCVKPYNEIAKIKGWPEISRRTVLEYLKRNKLTLTAARKGKKAFRDNITMQVTRTRPSMPLAFWSLDGWKAELYYQKKTVNKAGYNVQTYNNRLVIYIVLDCFNNYPLGYAIGEQENNELAKAALKNAADHIRELYGDYFRPYQIQTDRAGLKTLRPLFEDMAKHFTPAQVGNAKAKPVERYNRHLIDNYCQYLNNFSGYGIKSPQQPNIDIQNQIKKNFPDKEGLIFQLDYIIKKEREAKSGEMLKAWEELENSKKLILTREQYLYLFGTKTDRTIRFNGRGITPTIKGALYQFESFDLSFRKDLLTAWTLFYDNENLSNILAVSPDEKRRFLLQSKYKQPMALVDRKPGDAEELEKVRSFNKELESHVTDELSAVHETSQKILQSIRIDEVSEKAAAVLLTDSRGQHKEYQYFESYEDIAEVLPDKPKAKVAKAPKAKKISTQSATNDDYLEHVQSNVNIKDYLNI